MAYSVYAVAAAEFMAAFYESSVHRGQCEARRWVPGVGDYSSTTGRPSPKGDMPLADWLVPVHYMRTDVRFPAGPHRPPGRGAVAGCGA